MSAGRLFDLAVVFVVAGLGELLGGPRLGVVFLVIGILLLAFARQRTARRVDSVVPPIELGEAPSSSAMIQFIRDAYRRNRAD